MFALASSHCPPVSGRGSKHGTFPGRLSDIRGRKSRDFSFPFLCMSVFTIALLRVKDLFYFPGWGLNPGLYACYQINNPSSATDFTGVFVV